MILRAKNWGEFQHYKDRDPPWIKLHKRLLDDRVFHRLPDASRALAPMVWLLCSESKDGTIKDAAAEIAFRLRMTEKKAEEALNPLIEAGFFSVEQNDSTPIAPCEHDATQRQSREKAEEEESAFAAFVDAASKHGWPKPQKLDPDRRKKLRARLDEHGSDGWTAMLAKAGSSEFLCTKFPVKLDWILEPKNFRKTIEGNYDGKQVATDPQPTTDRDSDAQWKARLRTYRKGGFWMSNDWGPRPESGKSRVPEAILAAWEEAQHESP